MKRIAIVGAGLSGLTAAWQLTRPGAGACEVTLFEATHRTGGIVETLRQDGFTIELGPDSWVTEKPAARELLHELGLAHELLPSNDSTRKTHILLGDRASARLEAMPDGLRMMVPTSRAALAAIESSPLFSASARQAFRDELTRAPELQRSAPLDDESIASFTERHFGREVLDRIAAPLLSGVFGGDVHTLSVRAVMAPFVAMERERGSLILALEEREAERRAAGRPVQPIFTSLRSGLGTLTETLTAQLPAGCLLRNTRVKSIRRADPAAHSGWVLHAETGSRTSAAGHTADTQPFDHLILATPAHITAQMLHPFDPATAALLPAEASSAILVALAWPNARLPLPPGFGFLVPPPAVGQAPASPLLATTFVDQKFPDRAPSGASLLRAFFSGNTARDLLAGNASDEHLSALALTELQRILGPLSPPAFTHVRRWPLSLPQYAVGHLDRMALLDRNMAAIPGLHLLGNALHGVGLPDLIRQARLLARQLGEAS